MSFERASIRQSKWGFASVVYAFAFSALFSTTLLSQTIKISDRSNTSIPPAIRNERQSALVKEILGDIDTQTRPNQVASLGRLADTLWDIDRTFARGVLSNSVELALDPTTTYKSRKERIDVLSYLFVFEKLYEKDEGLAKRITAELKQLLLEPTVSTDSIFNSKSIFLATYFLKFDKDLAFEFARRSLANGQPAVDSNTTRFYLALTNKDMTLADRFFGELIDSVKRSNDHNVIESIISRLGRKSRSQFDEFSFQITNIQIERFISAIKPVLDKETRELKARKRANCPLTCSLGSLLSRLEIQIQFVSDAIEVCEKSRNVSAWDKPNFFRDKKPKTSQDLLALAKLISNENIRDHYTYLAALKARDENDLKLALKILDGLSERSRYRLSTGWSWTRMQVGEKLVGELMATKNYAEIDNVINGFPSELRPYFLLDILWRYGRGVNSPVFVKKARESVRNEILELNFPPPTMNSWGEPVNPAKFLNLVDSYHSSRLNEEALNTFDEFIGLQNLLSSKFAGKDANGNTISYFNASLSKNFIESNYDHVVNKLKELQSTAIRLDFRMNLLWMTTRNGFIGGGGVKVIE